MLVMLISKVIMIMTIMVTAHSIRIIKKIITEIITMEETIMRIIRIGETNMGLVMITIAVIIAVILTNIHGNRN